MANAEQIEYWNGEAGGNWVRQADALDLMLYEVGEAMLAHTPLRLGDRVLDIGSGAGASTFSAQERVGHAGQATGLDVSLPLVLAARQRAVERNSQATFIHDDAATWRGAVQADAIVSRFGVMFFGDPVAAFTNMLQLTRPGGSLSFACWGNPKESDMSTGLMSATASLFVRSETRADPTAPGPYAFADPERVSSILNAAGWRDVHFERWDGRLPLPGSNVRESATFAASIGALSRMMREQQVALERVVDALVPFLQQRQENDQIVLRGTAWFVSARRD